MDCRQPAGMYNMQISGELDSASNVTTPATSTSSAEEKRTSEQGTATPATLSDQSDSIQENNAPKNEADTFLSNSDNYLALGCLVSEDWMTDYGSESATDETEWEDVSHTPPHFVFDTKLSSNFSKLAAARWIKVECGCRSVEGRWFLIYRIYVLPGDAGLRFIDRTSRQLAAALEGLIGELNVSPEAWRGDVLAGKDTKFDVWATCEEGSLFYMFNKLPSPEPSISAIEHGYTREALEDLLKSEYHVPGLKAELYPYQRRSAGLMLQREAVSTLELDPRLERRIAPDGSVYYYGPRDQLFLRNPRYYESCRGGILAETMGLGKTLICLALILATRHHLPTVPSLYDCPPRRSKTASLAEMCVSNINRKSIPWKVEFDRIRSATKNDMKSCADRLESNPPSYEIPVEPVRWNRKTVLPPPKKITLAATSIIVVPRNLCKQWHSEIQKHVDAGGLNILVMEETRQALPPSEELGKYDVILFSRNRFESEFKDGADSEGRRLAPKPTTCRCPYIRATRTRDCHCVKVDDLYDSPLKHLHFKRLIIDEGHFFSAANTTAVSVANKLVTADHRWVVSGTPARDLLGVEVDMSAATVDNMWQKPETKESRDAVLDQRRHFSTKEDTAGAVKSLGSLASNFLRIRPWAALEPGERPANWDEYIYRHEDPRRKTYSGFSKCLRRTIQSMMIKTQPEDVERDIALPPLSHEMIRLEPSFYDKLTANLFTLVLTANAVTSERTDADYLFHKNSAKARYQLVNNLHQSAFFWTGFSEEDVLASKKTSTSYLESTDTRCTEDDRKLLSESLDTVDTILASDGWKGLSQSHELGLFVQDWPEESAEFWSFVKNDKPMLTGITQLLEAQKHVHERIGSVDPGEGLAGIGIKSLTRAREARNEDQPRQAGSAGPVLAKSGVPSSSIKGEPVLKRQPPVPTRSSKSFAAVRVPKSTKRRSSSSGKVKTEDVRAPPRPFQRMAPATAEHISGNAQLDEDSPYAHSRIVGSVSAKLSYLTVKILEHYEDEKILVFYDGENAAYYLMQMLELLHIKHETYAKSLKASQKSEYVVRFNEQPEERVLLMDVKQAAFGLNLSSASRVYFLNPVYRPNTEAQAIKRAHRIGQTRKVHVETLLLKGTLEEKMYERAKRMSRAEHQEVSHLEDDGGMREIIQSARIFPLTEEESHGAGQMAPLEVPQCLWGRPGWKEALAAGLKQNGKRKRPDTPSEDGSSTETAAKRQKNGTSKALTKMRQLAFVDVPEEPMATNRRSSEASAIPRAEDSSEDDKPIMHRWQRESGGRSAPTNRSLLIGSSNPMMPTMAEEQELAPMTRSEENGDADFTILDAEEARPGFAFGMNGNDGMDGMSRMIPAQMSLASTIG